MPTLNEIRLRDAMRRNSIQGDFAINARPFQIKDFNSNPFKDNKVQQPKPLDLIRSMRGYSFNNYIVPGLRSSLLDNGKVRLFESSRNQREFITPHSHRFDFTCLVLNGQVTNVTYTEIHGNAEGYEIDEFGISEIDTHGTPGDDYMRINNSPRIAKFASELRVHRKGEWYSMTHDQIHSITFSKDAVVLFFEGEQKSETSLILEPVVNGQVISTFKTEDWMFEGEDLSNG